jgi:GR25 family glycosyltransferase involved in LPS biosynthesis
MKRIAIIICSLLFLICVLGWTVYMVRKNKIEKQYVSKESTSVLSIAVDDLLLDNISSLLSKGDQSPDVKSKEIWIKSLILDAGISIPARIFLFNTADQKNKFYGILAIKNYEDCFSFFANHYPKGIKFINKEKGIVSVMIGKHIQILFDRNRFIYKIAFDNSSETADLESLLHHTDTWTQIGDLKGFEHVLSKKHINYVQKDKSLKIEASIGKNKTEIDGEWLLSQNIDQELQIRAMDTTNQTLTFWSLVHLKDIPILTHLMNKYTGLNEAQLAQNYSNYFDLQIKADPTTQRDTSITYEYDEDFNAVEAKKIQELRVPHIIQAWKYNKSLEESLPNNMFYQFHKMKAGQYLLQTTSDNFINQIESKPTSYPFYCFIDFKTWPEEWTLSLFKNLKDNKVQATIMTTLQDQKKLSIKGQINY